MDNTDKILIKLGITPTIEKKRGRYKITSVNIGFDSRGYYAQFFRPGKSYFMPPVYRISNNRERIRLLQEKSTYQTIWTYPNNFQLNFYFDYKLIDKLGRFINKFYHLLLLAWLLLILYYAYFGEK